MFKPFGSTVGLAYLDVYFVEISLLQVVVRLFVGVPQSLVHAEAESRELLSTVHLTRLVPWRVDQYI